MTKRYLLLRNNLESGPFTIDELLQQRLLPTDLLWVEGESHEWKYFKEVIDLGLSRIGENRQPFPLAMPGKKIAEEESLTLNNQVHAEAEPDEKDSWNPAWSDPSSVEKKPRTGLHDHANKEEEENIEFIYHKSKKSDPFVQLAILTIVIVVMAIAWRRNGSLFKTRDVVDQAAIPLVSASEHAAKAAKQPLSEIPAAITSKSKDDLRNIPSHTDSSVSKTEKEPQASIVLKPATVRTRKKAVKKIAAPALVYQRKEEDKIALPGLTDGTTQPPKEIILPQPQEAAVITDKKKSFGQVLKGLFHKKKRAEKAEAGIE